MSSATERPFDAQVLVLGASFAGIEVVLQLRRRAKKSLSIIVVDRQRAHGYLPLVHEYLVRPEAEPGTILPTADLIDALPHTQFVQDEVVTFDPQTKIVRLASGRQLRGRFIVVALGSVVTPPAAIAGHAHLVGYKSLDDAEHARTRLHEALAGSSPARIVVVGGGISGVELAGELGALATKRARTATGVVPQIQIVTDTKRLVPDLAPSVSDAVTAALREQSVGIELQATVVAVTPEEVRIRRGSEHITLPCDVALWAGGVRPAPVLADLPLSHNDEGWLTVGPSLQCFATSRPTQPDVFACGDAVRVVGGTGEWPTMVRAIECLWQAKVVAKNVLTLASQDAAYPEGVPPLVPHRLRRDFFYGVSVGRKSYVVYRGLRIHVPTITPWFRRWLMRQYFARYATGPSTVPPAADQGHTHPSEPSPQRAPAMTDRREE